MRSSSSSSSSSSGSGRVYCSGDDSCSNSSGNRHSDEVLLEVYRQFDGCAALAAQAESSDLLMLPLEIQVPVAGQGKLNPKP